MSLNKDLINSLVKVTSRAAINCYQYLGKGDKKLADKADPILGFRPSSNIKRGRIGIIISIICLVYVIIELIKSGVIDI